MISVCYSSKMNLNECRINSRFRSLLFIEAPLLIAVELFQSAMHFFSKQFFNIESFKCVVVSFVVESLLLLLRLTWYHAYCTMERRPQKCHRGADITKHLCCADLYFRSFKLPSSLPLRDAGLLWMTWIQLNLCSERRLILLNKMKTSPQLDARSYLAYECDPKKSILSVYPL